MHVNNIDSKDDNNQVNSTVFDWDIDYCYAVAIQEVQARFYVHRYV